MKQLLLSLAVFLALFAPTAMIANDNPSLVSAVTDDCVDCISYLCSKDVMATTVVFMSAYPEILQDASWKNRIVATACCPIVFAGCHLGASTDHLKKRAKEFIGHME